MFPTCPITTHLVPSNQGPVPDRLLPRAVLCNWELLPNFFFQAADGLKGPVPQLGGMPPSLWTLPVVSL